MRIARASAYALLSYRCPDLIGSYYAGERGADHGVEYLVSGISTAVVAPSYFDPPRTGVQAYVVRHRDHVILCVRGTDEIIDVARDLQAFPVKMGGCPVHVDGRVRVHAGIRAQADVLMSHCVPHIERSARLARSASAGAQPLIQCVGHSAGGMAAGIIALRLAAAFPRDVSLVTLGSPPVGNRHFVEASHDQLAGVMHIVNGDDPVPALRAGFCHGDRADVVRIGHRRVGARFSLSLSLADHAASSYLSSALVMGDPKGGWGGSPPGWGRPLD